MIEYTGETTMKTFLKMTDSELSHVMREVENILRSRSAATQPGCDSLGIIKGNEMAKRALLVAIAGNHSILFLGPHGVGKSMLRLAAFEFNHHKSFEALPCSCGFKNDPANTCNCTIAKIRKATEKWPHAEMFVEVPRLRSREMESKLAGTGKPQFQDQLNRMLHETDETLSDTSRTLMRHATQEMGITSEQAASVLRVARTIANLDCNKFIEPQHLSEAINYRLDLTTAYRSV
jgi:predicted ATPase with chaperone activity